MTTENTFSYLCALASSSDCVFCCIWHGNLMHVYLFYNSHLFYSVPPLRTVWHGVWSCVWWRAPLFVCRCSCCLVSVRSSCWRSLCPSCSFLSVLPLCCCLSSPLLSCPVLSCPLLGCPLPRSLPCSLYHVHTCSSTWRLYHDVGYLQHVHRAWYSSNLYTRDTTLV